MRPCVRLSKRQRRATPHDFAAYLIGRVNQMFHAERVAVLFTQKLSVYGQFWPSTDCWPQGRDATRYAGPWPIIAHPPCGPWGCFKWISREDKSLGIKAMELVHIYGGVVEQPRGSSLFADYGKGGWVEKVNQGDFGHEAIKPTCLYFYEP